MIWIDIVCLVCIVLFALLGLWRGFLKSIFRLCAWVLGFLGAYFAPSLLGGFIAQNLEISGFSVTLICICIGFLFPFLLFSLIGHFLNKAISESAISGINRILGATLGTIKALIICFMFLTIMHILPVSGDLKEARNNSLSYAAYKWSIEMMVFSSEEVDLAKEAEKKVDKITKEIANKATEKVKEHTNEVVKKVKDEAEKSVEKAKKDAIESVNAAKDSLQEKIDNAKSKTSKPDSL